MERNYSGSYIFTIPKSKDKIFMSDFTLNSICIIMSKLEEYDVLLEFIDDIVGSTVKVVSVKTNEIREIVDTKIRQKLDYDDAYQYYIAEREGLTIISYDTDFDHTRKGRKRPEEIQ